MGLVDRLAGSLGFTRRPDPRALAQAKRSFAAAQVNRLTQSWPTANTSFDYDLKASLKALRGRSRYLAQNNDYAKRFLQMCITHIVGPNGFSLQSQARFGKGTLDTGANDAIERAFGEWARRGVCESSGRLSFVDVQQLLVETAARDGEFLVRKVPGADNRFGFALQILDVDRLDVDRNESFPDGRRIVMGVELTPAGVPSHYWLHKGHPSDAQWQGMSRWERVPALEVYHGFRAQRPEQTRGCPWMHTAMARMQHLSGFEEAAVIAARVGASKMGFFTTEDGDATSLATDKGTDGALYDQVEPGAIPTLPAGVSFASFNPDYPSQAFDPFVKATLRGIASGLGVAYHTLANDLSGVNFSSARAGTLEERDNWMAAQEWFATSFLYPLFTDWLRQAFLRGAVTLANGAPLPFAQLERFNRPLWQGRRWQWVDPTKDIEANVAAIDAGLKSRRQVISEQGGDIEDVWLQLKAEEERAAAMGLQLGKKTPAPAPAEEENNEPEDAAT
jgi:lambda family phage portal protein